MKRKHSIRSRKWGSQVEKKEDRKIKARRDKYKNIWFGIGMYGLVGWSVAIPTLLGVAVGIWIDNTWPSRFSWTLMLLMAGLIIGCLNAWYWVKKESRMQEKPPDSSRR
jgi:ATP synthase protein I